MPVGVFQDGQKILVECKGPYPVCRKPSDKPNVRLMLRKLDLISLARLAG